MKTALFINEPWFVSRHHQVLVSKPQASHILDLTSVTYRLKVLKSRAHQDSKVAALKLMFIVIFMKEMHTCIFNYEMLKTKKRMWKQNSHTTPIYTNFLVAIKTNNLEMSSLNHLLFYFVYSCTVISKF